MKNGTSAGAPKKSYATVIALAAVAALVGFAAVYGTLGRPDNNADNGAMAVSGQSAATGEATASRKTVPDMPAFVFKATPEPLGEVRFTDGDGKPMTLADFKGKTILLNLWATWCAPCREEMPSLDRLQQEFGSDTFEVVALAVDRAGPETAQKFLDEIGVTSLKLYSDTTTRSGSALRAVGMPTTILIDAEGREIGRLPGPYEWDAPEAKALIQAELN
ncbi:redoxin [Hyphomicrobium nitrativorans NL23]|uniref:Redoxin n=1 Tax=Hyphomicrobium nitrativorans NL23 TaxID=1029756 RepID=V5S9R4_9HYPH|nr:TlpA disulfide reductase family protein [Hyphomicrobium nitrativorans]AHB47481.1 redoxin [Hyphomicrobium nitrativorans NL23]